MANLYIQVSNVTTAFPNIWIKISKYPIAMPSKMTWFSVAPGAKDINYPSCPLGSIIEDGLHVWSWV